MTRPQRDVMINLAYQAGNAG